MEHLFGGDHYEMTYWDKHQHKPGLIGLFRGCFMPPPTPCSGNWRTSVLRRLGVSPQIAAHQACDFLSPHTLLSCTPVLLFELWGEEKWLLRTFFRLEFKYLKMMLQVVLHIPTCLPETHNQPFFFFFFATPHDTWELSLLTRDLNTGSTEP